MTDYTIFYTCMLVLCNLDIIKVKIYRNMTNLMINIIHVFSVNC